MSQGQLAHATRLSRTYIYHLETGQRANPSPQVVQNIVRALELPGNERQRLFEAYTALTGQFLDQEQIESTLLNVGELASLLCAQHILSSALTGQAMVCAFVE